MVTNTDRLATRYTVQPTKDLCLRSWGLCEQIPPGYFIALSLCQQIIELRTNMARVCGCYLVESDSAVKSLPWDLSLFF